MLIKFMQINTLGNWKLDLSQTLNSNFMDGLQRYWYKLSLFSVPHSHNKSIVSLKTWIYLRIFKIRTVSSHDEITYQTT